MPTLSESISENMALLERMRAYNRDWFGEQTTTVAEFPHFAGSNISLIVFVEKEADGAQLYSVSRVYTMGNTIARDVVAREVTADEVFVELAGQLIYRNREEPK